MTNVRDKIFPFEYIVELYPSQGIMFLDLVGWIMDTYEDSRN
jgi:hypothetical protein